MKQFFIKNHSSIRLSIYDFGGKGLPIIFCHFTGGMGRLWSIVIRRLTKYFHCFAYDARGHGESSKPLEKEMYDWNEHLSDLIEVIKHIQEVTCSETFFGVGHSFGSACLSQAVVRTRKEVNWRRIVLIEPILGPEEFDFRKEKMSEIARKRKGVFETLFDIDRVLGVKNPYKNWDKKVWDLYKKYGFITGDDEKYYLKCSPEIESYQYLYGNPAGWFEKLKKIDIPVLLLYGCKSELLPLALPQLRQFKKGFLMEIPEAGHFLPQEKPFMVSKIIKQWFAI